MTCVMRYPRSLLLLSGYLTVLCPLSMAQEPVATGKGSFAASPPPGAAMERGVDVAAQVEARKLYLAKEAEGQPVPSNKWYQNLLLQPFGTGLWAMPHRVDATVEGIEVFHPSGFSGDGVRTVAEWPLVVTGRGFKPVDSRAKSWSDWSVAFCSFESDTRFMEVTLGEGMPAVWCEFTGVEPVIAAGGIHGKGSRAAKPPALFGMDGQPLTLPHTGDALGIRHEGRVFGVFAPEGTQFTVSGDGIAAGFPGAARFLVLCPMPSEKDMPYFHRHAFAVPRRTELTWDYNREEGTLTTTWKVEAEPLKPNAPRSVIQGFLPHHWRDNLSGLALDGPAWKTIRGPLRCTAGSSFSLRHAFNGIVPNFPAPAGLDKARSGELLAKFIADPQKKLGGDTYWGGKEVQRYAQAAFIAAQTGDPALEKILAILRAGMENWLTYTPGEKGQFFARYPRHGALVGFPVAYGSQHFTDTHFHQGYFVYAAALLAQLQPGFAKDYGEMARLIAKNYANWNAADRRFPRFRTFDLWRGHSFADGRGFPEGNNQESTGEAVNSWAALILLGEALGDPDMTAAGVMGYTFETRANVEYWFDPHGDVFPETYAHNACGMIWSSSIVWGTWFTASPSWIYGIQWLPVAPHMAFYDRHPQLIAGAFADVQREQRLFEEREAAKKGTPPAPPDVRALGGELGSYHLGFLMHADAARVLEEMDSLWKTPGDTVARNEWMLLPHYMATVLAAAGRVDWQTRADSPAAMACLNSKTGARTLVGWNPSAEPRVITFRRAKDDAITLMVPPYSAASRVVEKP